MQLDQQSSHSPPQPIQPAGFFSGIGVRPIVLGVVADYIATYVAIYAYFFVYLAKELSKRGEVTPEMISEYMLSTEGLLIGFTIGALGTALGGFVAGYKAGKFEMKHGAFVGAASLIVSFIQQGIQEEASQLPEWFRLLSLLAIIPAGALGGYVAQVFKGLAGPHRSPGGTWPDA
ncbi:MAG: YrzE family protein [Candidatus Binatia bacterium]